MALVAAFFVCAYEGAPLWPLGRGFSKASRWVTPPKPRSARLLLSRWICLVGQVKQPIKNIVERVTRAVIIQPQYRTEKTVRKNIVGVWGRRIVVCQPARHKPSNRVKFEGVEVYTS